MQLWRHCCQFQCILTAVDVHVPHHQYSKPGFQVAPEFFQGSDSSLAFDNKHIHLCRRSSFAGKPCIGSPAIRRALRRTLASLEPENSLAGVQLRSQTSMLNYCQSDSAALLDSSLAPLAPSAPVHSVSLFQNIQASIESVKSGAHHRRSDLLAGALWGKQEFPWDSHRHNTIVVYILW